MLSHARGHCLFSYDKMLCRAGYSPAKHLAHISKIQKKEGADSIKLGAVSGQQYKAIFKARAFDQYFFQIPPTKRWVVGGRYLVDDGQ